MEEAYKNSRNDFFRKQAGGDAAEENKPDGAGRIKVSYSEGTAPAIENGKLVMSKGKPVQLPVHNLFFYNLQPDDVQLIINELMSNKEQTRTLNAFVPRKNLKNCVQVRIGINDMDTWLNSGLPLVQNVLRQSGSYNEQEINDIPGYISNVAVSKQEMEQGYKDAESNAVDIWNSYLQDINNPEVRKKLEAYKRVYRYLGVQYGHVKSARNVATILSTDSNATFILTAPEWRKLNRYVKPNAQRFYVHVPLVDADTSEIDKIIEKIGWGGTRYRDLPRQVQQKVEVMCRESNIAPPFAIYLEFDISDTEVIPGEIDIFNEEMGLANNLTGELNDKAKADYAQKHEENAVPEDEEMAARTQKAADFILQFLQKHHVPFNPAENTDASTILVDGLYAYYKFNAEADANIDKDTNKDIFARNATYFTLLITGLALEKSGNFSHPVTYSKKEAAEFMNSVMYVLKRLEPAVAEQTQAAQAIEVNESAEQNVEFSKQEILQKFMEFCKQTGIKII